MTDAVPQWSDERVAEAFCAEIRARFEAYNVAYRAREEVKLEQVLRDHPEKQGQPDYEVRDSSAWRFYKACAIRIDRYIVTIVAPGPLIDMDLVYLFDNITVAWSKPLVKAAIVDGEPRLTIEIILVHRRRGLVELFEDEVHALADAADRPIHVACNCGDYPPDERPCVFCSGTPVCAETLVKLRDRLKLALEHLL